MEYTHQVTLPLQGAPIYKDGVYWVYTTMDNGDNPVWHKVYFRSINGICTIISKEEYDAEVPTVNPPY